MKRSNCARPAKACAHSLQRGVSLLFTLMALIVLGFGAVALARSVGDGTLIMGNLGFKHDVRVASFTGTERAIAWLQTNLAETNKTDDASGYYAHSIDDLDATGNKTSGSNRLRLVQWDGVCTVDASTFNDCNTKASPEIIVNGSRVRWVITRLCIAPGEPGGANSCARPPLAAPAAANDHGEVGPGGRIVVGTTTPYFRIIVRVAGPRNTVSLTESLVHF